MLRAVLFDFNGVIVADEPLHFALIAETLQLKGVSLTKLDYFEKYLGLKDADCFASVLTDFNISYNSALIHELVQTKMDLYAQKMVTRDLFVPGVIDFIKNISQGYFLGIVSGAARSEIVYWLKKGGVQDCFQTIVSAEDVTAGKPDPEGFYLALNWLNRDSVPSSEPILPQEALVIEDSKWGIDAACSAGMKVIGLTTSSPPAVLQKADWVVNGYEEVDFSKFI